ncbi:MAG: hypothetical protein J6O23_06240 [Prevotella sp.]|nr:hypothetical protein [Prevotella sp.]
MKKIYNYITLVLMVMTSVTLFTGCDDRYWNDNRDRDEAYTLEGTWTGYIDTYLYDRFGIRGDSYRTTMYFERENSYGGWGYELDYNLYSIYDDYYYCEFRWDVVNGNIRISYADSWNTVYIYDYTLTDYHFRGYMDDGTTRDIYFDLAYDSRFDWGYWTRGVTRGTADGHSFKASGEFAGKGAK